MCVNSDSDFVKTRQNTIELTIDLLKKHNFIASNVFRHFYITGKDCPKMMIDRNACYKFLLEVENYNVNAIKHQ